jgi:DDE family transposase
MGYTRCSVRNPIIRGDSHYGRPEVMDWYDGAGINFVFGLAGNDALRRLVELAADDVRVRRAEANAAASPLHRKRAINGT